MPDWMSERASMAICLARWIDVSGYVPSPISLRFFDVGDMYLKTHLPRPFLVPDISLKPVMVPSAKGAFPGSIVFAFSSVNFDIQSHITSHYFCKML